MSRRILFPLLLAFFGAFTSLAWSQSATVTYSAIEAVPVIGGGLLVVLGVCLAVLGVLWLSRRPNVGRTLSVSVTVIGTAMALGSSGWLATSTQAQAVIATFLLSENSSPITITDFPAELNNDLTVPVTLRSIDIAGCPAAAQLTGSCSAPQTLAAAGGSCTIESVCGPGGTGEVCDTGTEFSTGDPWVVCEASASEAWISANVSGTYNADAICQSLGYDQVGQHGGTCGSVCGYCEDTVASSCSSPGAKTFDGGGGSTTSLGSTVQWTCVNVP